MTSRTMTRTIVIALVAMLTSAAPVRSQEVARMHKSTGISNESHSAKLPNIVLLHGAWGDASSWSHVIERLQKAGYNVTSTQLVFASMDEDVARTRAVLATQAGPTLLVGHSFAGAVMTQLGTNAPNVVGLLYESAFAPDQGETMKALVSGDPQPASSASIRPDKQGMLWLDAAGFIKYFAPDVNPIEARVMQAVQTPIAASELFSEEKFGPPAWRTLPSWYLITENDQMLPPRAQHFFAKRMGATVTSIAASHVSMVSHPDLVANFIMKAAHAVQAK
jgi:pimeloyl-ACP methyl ester carboxylesterase